MQNRGSGEEQSGESHHLKPNKFQVEFKYSSASQLQPN